MALLTESRLRSLAKAQRGRARDSADSIAGYVRKTAALSSFHIFLSHSHLDVELIDGTVKFLEVLGYSVYLDTRVDPAPRVGQVTKAAAEQVRFRLKQCKSLFFATTEGAKDSRWMPWELGYMDGMTARCAILPISSAGGSGDAYEGREYLGVYPYIASAEDTQRKERIWVHDDFETYVSFDKWLGGSAPHRHG
jgi:hypothetical protein